MSLYPEYEKSMPIFRQSNTVLLFRKHLVTFESREFDVQFGSPFSNKKKKKKNNAGIRYLSFSKISDFNTHFFLYTFP